MSFLTDLYYSYMLSYLGLYAIDTVGNILVFMKNIN